MLLRWTLFFSVLSRAAAQSCYYPDGGLSSSDAPCTDGNGDSFCCSSSYYCLSNRLCQWQDGRLYRGSCTDEDWTSGNCPQFCQDNNPANGIQLFQCSISLNTYCCSTNNSDPNTCCNSAGVELITLAAPTTIGQIVSTAFVNFQTSSTSASTTRSSSSSSSTSSSSSSSSPTTSISSSETSTSTSISSSRTGSGTASTTASAPASETSGSGGSGGGSSNTGAIAGGAVGGIAVLGAVALGAWWIWVRKRKGSGGAAGDAPTSPHNTKEHYQFYGGPQGGYYQSAPQHEPREMDGGQQMIPQEMDTGPRRHANAWHELPADSSTHR